MILYVLNNGKHCTNARSNPIIAVAVPSDKDVMENPEASHR